MSSKVKEWGAFIALALIWGTSFLWIKIAVDGSPEAVAATGKPFGSFLLVAFRLLFGLLGMIVIVWWRKQPLPHDRNLLRSFFVMAVVNTAIPFVLITWGETAIPSSWASIVNATVPLFTIVIAHFWLHDEKITVPRLTGLIIGFVGILVLFSNALGESVGSALGQGAVVLASISYAAAITFARKYLRNQNPIVQSTMVLLLADVVMWIATPIASQISPEVGSLSLPTHWLRWFAVVWLGVLGSCLAYLLFFFLNNVWGPTRASLVTYTFPVIGLILGIVFLGETAGWRLLLGSVLIVGGIVVVNLRR